MENSINSLIERAYSNSVKHGFWEKEKNLLWGCYFSYPY